MACARQNMSIDNLSAVGLSSLRLRCWQHRPLLFFVIRSKTVEQDSGLWTDRHCQAPFIFR